jgi:hypothetical protein
MCDGFDSKKIKVGHRPKYSRWYFEGGSTKGYAYPFTIRTLMDYHIINYDDLKHTAGTSAGSLAAFLCAAKVRPETMVKMMGKDFSELLDDAWGVTIDAWNFIQKYGVCPGDSLESWLRTLIMKATGNGQCTFKMLKRETGVSLHVPALNLNTSNLVWFDSEKTPHEPIYFALKASMALPGVYQPVPYRGDLLSDGGSLVNLPDLPGGHGIELGFMLKEAKEGQRMDINGLGAFWMSVAAARSKMLSKMYVSKSLWSNTVEILTGDVSCLDFDLSDLQKRSLEVAGRNGAKKFMMKKGWMECAE